ncbi:hypothetical protein J4G43_049700 [Bradyrhizobium barranii subsp. barranii]|uniref:Serine-threonine protein kinase n=1 Tax=Bradyrhizobium barranii subsp. barranii TaxID=2823807 RepID=A0A939LY88_9BRAD|nr:hypothetical protein [Bradyrhizobium barranii]UEM12386.1 hypothetical protein J4G43_049700 [Bradyrhizobium barranii subsp. barranii]
MDIIAGMPFFRLEITKDGQEFSASQKAAIENSVRNSGAAQLTDLFVISHGWNNDSAEAQELYEELFANLAALMPGHAALRDRKFAVVGIFWPSKKFADNELIPSGGAASLDDGAHLSSLAVKRKLDSLKGTFDVPDEALLEHAKMLIDGIESEVTKQEEFVNIIRSLVPNAPTDAADDASDQLFAQEPRQLLAALSKPSFPAPARGGGGIALGIDEQAGGVASFEDFFTGIKAAAWRLLNYATYYQMKERAGVVSKVVNGVLGSVRNLRPDLRIHLIGHSFGARVVTAAVDGPTTIRPSSLSLLQGAFSHNGFSERFDGGKDGYFRKVVGQSKVAGPILATHTVNDKAVGIAYAIASRLSFDNANALGDENDIYGGIGRNGAVKMKSVELVKGTLLPASGVYRFVPRKVHNLRADAFIGNHSDVKGPQVAHAILSAVGIT